MEPQLPKPQFTPEMNPTSPQTFQGGEAFTVPKAPEAVAPVEQGRETHEQVYDGPKGDPVSAQPSFTPPPLPVVDPLPPGTGDPTRQTDASNPTTAADEDIIEREWVEKAKKVVAENRNDPHAQDVAIGKLQADYLKKRYGKVIALPKEE